MGAGDLSGSKLCLRFECIPAKKHTDSIFCTSQPVSLSLAADRGEGGGADRPLLTSDLLRVLWSPHRKQELANSSDVTLPDRPLSPPLTAPPTMKVRGFGLVSGEGTLRGAGGSPLTLAPGPAASVPSVGAMEPPRTSGCSVHLR